MICMAWHGDRRRHAEVARKREKKVWYFGTRLGRWYLLKPSEVPEYKRYEYVTQSEMKRIGKEKAKGKVLSPSFIR